MSKKGMGAAKNAMMAEEIEDSEEEGNEIASAVNLGKTIQPGEERPSTAREANNGVALHKGCTSSVAGKPWLRKYVQELTKKAKRKVKGPDKSKKVTSLEIMA